ncbi:MAG: hypothetical protein U1F43_37730 [Myxococcota bacterium]
MRATRLGTAGDDGAQRRQRLPQSDDAVVGYSIGGTTPSTSLAWVFANGNVAADVLLPGDVADIVAIDDIVIVALTVRSH